MPQAPEDLRDYFAAHAPEVPDWFLPLEDELAKLPPEPGDEEGVSSDTLTHPREEWARKKAQVEAEHVERRYFEWPWYYAEEMVKRRGEAAKKAGGYGARP